MVEIICGCVSVGVVHVCGGGVARGQGFLGGEGRCAGAQGVAVCLLRVLGTRVLRKGVLLERVL